MPCSAVTLSIATICAIIATALLAIAFSTDNWLHYDVWRNQIQVSLQSAVYSVFSLQCQRRWGLRIELTQGPSAWNT